MTGLETFWQVFEKRFAGHGKTFNAEVLELVALVVGEGQGMPGQGRALGEVEAERFEVGWG